MDSNKKIEDESIDKLIDFLFVMSEESERACIIMGGSFVDEYLEMALKKILLPAYDQKNDELFEPENPLGTFSAKIRLAYRMKLIDKDFMSTLNILRKLRNQFAHTFQVQTLDQSPHKERIISLQNMMGENVFYQKVLLKIQNLNVSEFMAIFIAIISTMGFYLRILIEVNDPICLKYCATFKQNIQK